MEKDWLRVEAEAREVLRQHEGVAKMATFVAARITNRQVAALAARGVLERPRYGWYVDPELPWQAKCAIRVGGVLGCASAAESYGLPVPSCGRRIHAVVPANSARLRHHRDKHHYVVPEEDADVRVHWAEDGREVAGWRTSLVDSLLALVECVPEDWFIAAVDAALHRPWQGEPVMSAEQYATFCALLPRRKRRLLRHVDPTAGSVLESLLRLGMRRRGITGIVPQFSPDGRRFVDFLVGARLIVEADGEAFHDPDRDAARDADFGALGYSVLRFSSSRILTDLEAVLDEIEAALESAF